MKTRLALLFATFWSVLSTLIPAHADTPKKIQWGVPLEYSTHADPANTDIAPRIASSESSHDNETVVETEDIAATEERLNSEVRILWDEIEKAEQQQNMSNDIKVLPITKNKPNPEKNLPKQANTKTVKKNPPPAAAIKAEKERIDTLLHSTKDKNGKIIAQPKDKLDKLDKSDKTEKLDPKTSKNSKTKTTPNSKTPTPPAVVILPQPTAQPKPVLTRKQVLEEEIAREKAALKSAQTQLAIARKRGNNAQIQKLLAVIRDRELNVQAISRELAR